jgi:hypothetical protein
MVRAYLKSDPGDTERVPTGKIVKCDVRESLDALMRIDDVDKSILNSGPRQGRVGLCPNAMYDIRQLGG